MTAIVTGASLRATTLDHTVFSDKALAEALDVSVRQVPELRRQADALRRPKRTWRF